MDFFNSAVDVLQTLVIALGAGLGIWGGITSWRGTATITPARMLMCDKVAHKNLIDDSPLFRKTQDIITCPALCFCFQID